MGKFNSYYKKSVEERQDILASHASLTDEEKSLLKKNGNLDIEVANRMIENVIGTFSFPMGIIPNMIINNKHVVVPMVVEEPSVIAAAANTSKMANEKGGFTSKASEPIMIAQIQMLNVPDAEAAIKNIEENKDSLLSLANSKDEMLVKFGGGAKDLIPRKVSTKIGEMLIVHLLVDVRDAMGANAVNTMAEALAPKLEDLTKGNFRLRILSNLAVYRTVKSKATWTKDSLEKSTKGQIKGEEVVDRIIEAYHFAASDPFRAATHNKGVMNGIDPVILATGNDWRAIESGAHAFASHEKQYTSLTKYYKDENGDLVGEIELPLAVGLVGGATKTHPMAQISLKIMGNPKTAGELGEIIAAVGLAENLASMRALATEGIQRGHMKLHVKNVAVKAGAKEEEIEAVTQKMIEAKDYSQKKAEEALKELRGE